MKSFNELGLAEPILRAVIAEGYTTPTPIQAEVIPTMLEGHDIIGIAQTGTGKTAAFVLPILHKLAAQKIDAQRFVGAGPKAFATLILAPTRELANQICESIRVYGKFMRPTVALVVGGASPVPQIRALAGGVDIVVATPGRLLDHMRSGKARLDKTTTIVLDEADQMLDLGFMPAITEIMRKIGSNRQTLLLSATMPRPIRALAQEFMKTPKEIAVAQVSKPAERIEQKIIMVDQPAKSQTLVDILVDEGIDRAIVFTRTKHGADKLNLILHKAGLSSVAIHGNKTQGQRNLALSQFRAGKKDILVATDVAARGIDIDDVSHVFNFDLPNAAEAYVHRIGRTARAGRSGIAISFCDRSERGMLRDIERLTNTLLTSSEESVKEGEVARVGHFTLMPMPAGYVRKEENRRPGGRPNSARPNGGRPNGGRPNSARPFAGKPNAGRPNTARPTSARPDGSPSTGESGGGKPAGPGRSFAGKTQRSGSRQRSPHVHSR